MYENLKGKKLLVIGSDGSNIAAIETAQKLGIYVIVIDSITDKLKTPSKQIADEAWDIDYSDLNTIEEKCREAGVNGVFAGYSEFRVLAALAIAERMGFPFYANKEQIDLTRNKRLFKDESIKYGIKVPKDYSYKYPVSEEVKAKIEYPAIVKPADYAGRKGITICEDASVIDKAIEYAASKSQSKTVIIEEYLEGTEYSSVYTLVDGRISLSCVNEKYITDDQDVKSGLCEFLVSPGFLLDEYIKEVDPCVKAFLKGINAKNGIAFFQGMYTKKGIYIFEMGYRVNGNNDFTVIEQYNDINYMKMLINFSLTGTMGEGIEKDNPHFNSYTATMPVNVHAGTVGKIDYSKLTENKAITDIHCSIKEGSVIVEDGSTQQKVMSFRINANTIEELSDIVDYCNKYLIIEDENGKNMRFKPFDSKKLLENHSK